MRSVIVLAMHGAPPRDLPRDELAEFINLHLRIEQASSFVETPLIRRCIKSSSSFWMISNYLKMNHSWHIPCFFRRIKPIIWLYFQKNKLFF